MCVYSDICIGTDNIYFLTLCLTKCHHFQKGLYSNLHIKFLGTSLFIYNIENGIKVQASMKVVFK